MANLPETPTFEPSIYQLSAADPVEGGPSGVSNLQAKQLANRTAYLKAGLDEVEGEVDAARSTFDSLGHRLDYLDTKAIEALSFRAGTPNTGGGNFQTITGYTATRYGTACQPRDASTFKLAKQGLYEILAFHKVEGFSVGANSINSSIQAFLVHDGGAPILLDNQLDTSDSEPSEDLYGMVFVDPSWVDPYVYFQRDGAPAGTIRGSIKYLGEPPLDALTITTGDQTFQESATQTFPDYVLVPLGALSAVGAVTWSIVTGAGLQDGTTDPKAEIVSGNQLKLTFTGTPTVPNTWQVKVQAVDQASTPRTTQKVLNITLNPYAVEPLTITSTDKSFAFSGAGPFAVQFGLTGSGGITPYTWSIVAGADTTLPGAAIGGTSSDQVTGSVTFTQANSGPYKVRVRLTDSATPTATVVEKVLNITMSATSGGGGSDPGCVPAGTWVGLADGSSIPAETVKVGQVIRAYDDATFGRVDATVQEVFVYEGRKLFRVVTEHGFILCSGDHRIFLKDAPKGYWQANYPPVESMLVGLTTLWETAPGVLEETPVLSIEPTGIEETVYHLSLDKGHLFVAGGLVAHNIKMMTP